MYILNFIKKNQIKKAYTLHDCFIVINYIRGLKYFLLDYFICFAENTLSPSCVEALAYFVNKALTFIFSVA